MLHHGRQALRNGAAGNDMYVLDGHILGLLGGQDNVFIIGQNDDFISR